MGKEYRIHIRGKQREDIDADLMAQLVILIGRQLAEEAKQAQTRAACGAWPTACASRATAARTPPMAQPVTGPGQPGSRPGHTAVPTTQPRLAARPNPQPPPRQVPRQQRLAVR